MRKGRAFDLLQIMVFLVQITGQPGENFTRDECELRALHSVVETPHPGDCQSKGGTTMGLEIPSALVANKRRDFVHNTDRYQQRAAGLFWGRFGSVLNWTWHQGQV